jgi:hypothetical protein
MVLKNNVVSITKNPHVSGSLNDSVFNKLGHPSSTCTIDMNYNSKRINQKQSITSIFITTNHVILPDNLTEDNLPILPLFQQYSNLVIKPDTFIKPLIVDLKPYIVRRPVSYAFVDMNYIIKEGKQIYISVYEPLQSLNKYNVIENTLYNMSTLQLILNLFRQYSMLKILKVFYEFFNNMTIKVSYLNIKDNVSGNVLQLHNTKTNDDLYVYVYEDQVFVNNQPLSTYKEPNIEQICT